MFLQSLEQIQDIRKSTKLFQQKNLSVRPFVFLSDKKIFWSNTCFSFVFDYVEKQTYFCLFLNKHMKKNEIVLENKLKKRI